MGALSTEEALVQEAAAIHGATSPQAIVELEELATPQSSASRRARKDADERSGEDEKPQDVEHRKKFYRTLNRLNSAALCCSGGGIRSATFCLGVIQALAMHCLPQANAGTSDYARESDQSLLSRFHYLSTVSGGGYIGSWLSAWRHRNDFPTVWRDLTGRPDGPDIEPPEISWLRSYSNYLTPKLGLLSADTWVGIAIYVRNLVLNWLVIVPAIAVALLVLKLIATVSIAVARAADMWWLDLAIALFGISCLIVAQAFTTAHRPTRRTLPGTAPVAATGNVDERAYVIRDLFWNLLSAVALTSFLTSQVGVDLIGGVSIYYAMLVAAGAGVVVFAGGWLAGRPLNGECKDFARWAISGAFYGALLAWGVHLFALLSPYAGRPSYWTILVPVVFGVPWVLFAQLFAEVIFIGLVSYQLNSDADREWLGRAAGWVGASAIIWMLTTAITFAGDHLLIAKAYSWLGPYIASAGGIAGIIGALIGKSAQTAVAPTGNDNGAKDLALKIGLAVAGPIFAAVLTISVSIALDLLLLGDSMVDGLSTGSFSAGYVVLWLIIGLVAAGIVTWVASRSVNINRFSLHAIYRNRLVRAYLGATKQHRDPDKFTGFDDGDNPPMHQLWPPARCPDGSNFFNLFHVVNITLNVVEATRLAWQERKAESFTVSPLHCGAAYKGFRPSKEYGGPVKPFGISLGTAMAISGAAVSPNMGYHSSPAVGVLLALFNVRLGWWLGNPGKEGDSTYKDEGPATAIVPLMQETFGLTTDDRPYVYLSDGGHFENLGIYEMVRRRCRFIVAVDAGCDPKFAFEDLGNAVRKIFIDLGIRITFDGLDKLKNHPTEQEKAAAGNKIPYHAIGTIHYREADGGDCEDGQILYIKPAYHGTEGAGVRSYASAHPEFPHESTGDQWFTEAQFESYRSLGLDIVNDILPDRVMSSDDWSLDGTLARLTPSLRR